MKLLGLDIGDKWTGIAISDALGWFARPLKTVATKELVSTVQNLIVQEAIETIIVGLPKTLRGTESEQTIKTKKYGEELQKKFSTIAILFWDERLTSKQAERMKKAQNKEDKLAQHAIAAALILGSYLDHQQFLKNLG